MKFVCPDCGKEVLEEVMDGVVVYSSITSISECGDHEYDTKHRVYENGDSVHYQCMNCGFILKTKNGEDICTCEDLVSWLKSHMIRIIVVVEGGVVQNIFSSHPDLDIDVLDHDNARNGLDDETAEKTRVLNERLEKEIKEKGLEIVW